MELKVGAAYIRVSTDRQEEYSPDSQLKIIREHAKRQGYIIPDEFTYALKDIASKHSRAGLLAGAGFLMSPGSKPLRSYNKSESVDRLLGHSQAHTQSMTKSV